MDAVVLGGGFAGIAAALRLAQAGHQVKLIERDQQLGGKAQGWQGIPTGPTVLTMPQVILGLFERCQTSPPELVPVSPLTSYHYSDGRVFAPEQDLTATLAQLSSSEAQDYSRLLESAAQLYRDAAQTFLFGPPPQIADLMRYGLAHGVQAHPERSLLQHVQSGPYLTPFFLRFATYMGANPYKAPAVLHNIAHVELGMGVWHSTGGFSALVAQLAEQLDLYGVEVILGQKVTQINHENGKVRHVQTANQQYTADIFVSALDRMFTLRLLGKPQPRIQLGVSGLSLQLELSEDAGLGHHIYFPSDYRAEWQDISQNRLPKRPTLYFHTDGHKGFVLVNAPAVAIPNKDRYAQQVLHHLHKHTGLNIVRANVMAPQDYARSGYHGALYGRAPHGLLGSLRFGWELGLSNLRQVGGTVHPGGGVPLSILSGWNGAGQLVGLPYDDLGAQA